MSHVQSVIKLWQMHKRRVSRHYNNAVCESLDKGIKCIGATFIIVAHNTYVIIWAHIYTGVLERHSILYVYVRNSLKSLLFFLFPPLLLSFFTTMATMARREKIRNFACILYDSDPTSAYEREKRGESTL